MGEKPEGYEYRITKEPKADTLNYWYKPDFEVDTTFFIVTNKKEIDTFKHRFRKLEKDSLALNIVYSSTLNFDQDFTLEASTPLSKIDASKITLIEKDSLDVPFEVEYDSILNRVAFKVEKEEGQKYYFNMLPETFTDFFESTNKDTLSYTVRTKMKSEYGKIRVNLKNAKFPLIVQLVDSQGKVEYERYTTDVPVVDFRDILPKQYGLRAIFDSNANKKYDSGNYLLGLQPERVSYAPPIPEVRANFDQIIEFILLE
jgi:hypothetical protein